MNELKRLKGIIVDFQTLEDMVVILFRSINLYCKTSFILSLVSVGDLEIGKKKIEQNTQLETLLPPKIFIKKMMQIFKMTHLNKVSMYYNIRYLESAYFRNEHSVLLYST